MKRVIVMGCHTNGLGVIRSLGLKGLQVIAISCDRMDFAQASKYVHEKVEAPHPRGEEREFIEFLLRNSYRWKDALILDTNDDFSVSISKNRSELAKYYKIATPEWEVLRTFIRKQETYKLAEKCGVPYPETFLPQTLDELQGIKGELDYPCLLKPVLGHEFMSRFNAKNFKANSYEELVSKFELCLESKQEVMVQEIIPGPDSNVCECTVYVNSNGDFNATFISRKLRQNPPQFGVARVAISENGTPRLEEFTGRMLREVGFKGIAHTEFKKDPRDGGFKLIEINGRILRSNWLAAYCGVNFPWIAYNDLVCGEQIKVSDYRKGVYWIEMYQDIANSLLRYDKENLGLKDYIEPYLSKDKTFADLSKGDFMPFLKRIAILPFKHYILSKSR